MSNLPENLKYANTHTWAQEQADGAVRVGITDFAQSELGDVMFVNLPKLGETVQPSTACGSIESVKTASELFSPVSGEVVAINPALQDAPELVNEDAYVAWLFCVKPSHPAELEGLMDAAAYATFIDE